MVESLNFYRQTSIKHLSTGAGGIATTADPLPSALWAAALPRRNMPPATTGSIWRRRQLRRCHAGFPSMGGSPTAGWLRRETPMKNG